MFIFHYAGEMAKAKGQTLCEMQAKIKYTHPHPCRHTHTHSIGLSDLCEFLRYSLSGYFTCIISKVICKMWNERMGLSESTWYIFHNVHIFQSVLIIFHWSPFIMLCLVISLLAEAVANMQTHSHNLTCTQKKTEDERWQTARDPFMRPNFRSLHALSFIVAHFYDGTSTKNFHSPQFAVQCP